MMKGQLDDEKMKLQQGLKDKLRNAKQEHSETLEETRERRNRESAHKIDKERERFDQKSRTESNQKFADGKTNAELDNERNIRDLKKK
jgi:hypothetical protein